MTTIKLELNEDKLREWEQIMRECEIVTYEDLFNNALVLLRWARERIKDGDEIEAVNYKKHRCLRPKLPALSAARPQKPSLSVVRKQ